ncbi:hypothetical protein SM124_06220 [Bacillus sp. 31A1R]|uniref:Uncharacterized protein n=1 Tax=Robertmurraya mangrovi TaxID=3098077 RepID=A0ABU5IW14_9BACI|nr:hypothetical protein [Bacillus sp. 31A1R]MDZ5471338.1 hypothetical protein [Bacillus sp. 31A1R]
MKKYLYFLMLFGVFFPTFHKIAIVLDNINLCSSYSILTSIQLYGLDSMKNLIISSLAALTSYFFTNVFLDWDTKKKDQL